MAMRRQVNDGRQPQRLGKGTASTAALRYISP